ncbi:thiopeptide-type bacteriocin biosynthesis protein [Pseudoduganella sp. HUAS MS19]
MGWRSIHLFLADPARADAFLLEVIAPCMDELCACGQAASWFYIRYWEQGPHLRLRVRDMPAAPYAQLLSRLRAQLAHYVAASQAWPLAYPDDMVFERPDVDAVARRWLPQGTVREIAYVPELQRYGGAQALAISERLFALSSALALRVVAASPDPNARRSRGLLLTSVALAAASGERASLLRFLRQMQATWQAILGEVGSLRAAAQLVSPIQRARYLALIEHLQAGRPAPPGIAGEWWAHIQQAIAGWRALARRGLLQCPLSGQAAIDAPGQARAIAALLDAHIHMMNNRLGLSPEIEYWYACMLEHAVQVPCTEEVTY